MPTDLTEIVAAMMLDGKERTISDIAVCLGCTPGTSDHRDMIYRLSKVNRWLRKWGYLERICHDSGGRAGMVWWKSTGRPFASSADCDPDASSSDAPMPRGDGCAGCDCPEGGIWHRSACTAAAY